MADERFLTVGKFQKYMADYVAEFQEQLMNTMRQLARVDEEDRVQNAYTGSILTEAYFHKYMADFQLQIFNTIRLRTADRMMINTTKTTPNQQPIPETVRIAELADDAFPLSSLPFDISARIFLKLRFKAIICCRCVCKPWRKLLSHPDFVKLHFANSRKNPRLLIRSHFQSFYSISSRRPIKGGNSQTLVRNFPLNTRQCNTIVIGHCNGLLCIAIRQNDDGPLKLVLWNPSIGDFNVLPHADHSHEPVSDGLTNLLVGLGYEPRSDDYRMVRARFRQGAIQPCVYSLRTNSWKYIETPPPSNVGFPLDSPVHGTFIAGNISVGSSINGTIYWLLYYYGFNYTERWIVGFNLKDEIFVKQNLWEGNHAENDLGTNIFAMEESVGVYVLSHTGIELWKLDQKNNPEWINQYKIPMGGTVHPDSVMLQWMPVCVIEQRKVCLYSTCYHNRNIYNLRSFAAYDTEAKRLLSSLDITWFEGECFDIVPYIQTLVSPKMQAGIE